MKRGHIEPTSFDKLVEILDEKVLDKKYQTQEGISSAATSKDKDVKDDLRQTHLQAQKIAVATFNYSEDMALAIKMVGVKTASNPYKDILDKAIDPGEIQDANLILITLHKERGGKKHEQWVVNLDIADQLCRATTIQGLAIEQGRLSKATQDFMGITTLVAEKKNYN